MEWLRTMKDGIYQLIGYGKEVTVETKLDVRDGKCKELWDMIKTEYPEVTGYRSFCKAYKEGKEEFDSYAARDEKRYKKYWRK